MTILTMLYLLLKTPLETKLLVNQPAIPQYVKVELAINKYCKHYKLQRCREFKSVIELESNYCTQMVNEKSKDYGCGQINRRTSEYFMFNKHRLLTDIDYSIRAAAIVYKYYNQEVCKYHLGPNPDRLPQNCIDYKNKIKQFSQWNRPVKYYYNSK